MLREDPRRRPGRQHAAPVPLVLNSADTLAVRYDAIPGPPPEAAACGAKGDPVMITVTIWHNVAHDTEGRHTAMTGGYQPGDPVVRVFTYQADPAGRAPEAIAEEAFAICNGHPRDAAGEELSRRYYTRELRSLSAGDVVAVGEAVLAVGRFGWAPLRGSITEVRLDEHGTHPVPASRCDPQDAHPVGHKGGDTSYEL